MLDRETVSEYQFEVIATDSGGLSSTATVTVTITDVNDNAPVVSAVVVLSPVNSITNEQG